MAGLFGSPEIQRLAEDDPEEYYKQTPFVRSLWESRLPTWLGQAYKQDIKPAIDAASAPTMEQVLRAPYNLASGAVKGAIDTIDSAQKDPSNPRKMLELALMTGTGGFLGGAPRGSLGMFAGRRAKTANLEKMKIAQKMLDDGVDRTDVWKQTGWIRGPDGKMRFEIDDSGSVANPINKKGQNYLPTALSHQGLYEAYPDLNRTSINLRGKTGLGSVYHPTPDNIKIGQFSGAGDLPPEIRHAKLQEVLTGINNEIKALNSRVGQKGLKQGSPEYIEYMALVDSFKKAQKSAGKTTGSKATPDKSVTLHETQHAIQEREGFAEGGGGGSSAKAKDEYRRLAGEAEARNVQTRMDYSPEQRLDEPPWTTLDVPEADQIVRGATDGSQMSIPMDEASRMARAKETAEMRRKGNIERFGYDPNDAASMAAFEDTSYRMQHQPRGPDSDDPIRLDDLTRSTNGNTAGYPDDFYGSDGSRLYAPGPRFSGDEGGISNIESYNIAKKVRGNPDGVVTIYRAVPNEDKINKINQGDFVTLSPKYAEVHGSSGYGRSGNDSGKIISEEVKVKDVYWAGDDINEFGYFPQSSTKTPKAKPSPAMLRALLKDTDAL